MPDRSKVNDTRTTSKNRYQFMSKRQTKNRTQDAVPPAGKNLTEEQRRQMEKKDEAEHEDGKERENEIKQTQALDER